MLKILLAFVPVFSFAQNCPAGSRFSSLAHAAVATTDAWTFFSNPAASAFLPKASIGFSYENRFLLKELQSQALVYNQPLKTGVLSLGAQTYGFKYFRQLKTGLGYSFKLNDFLSAGVQISYQGLWFSEYYGYRQAVIADAGLLIKINEYWSIGTSIFNLGRTKVNRANKERWSTDVRIGVGYKLSPKVLILSEIDKNVNHPLRLKCGVEYQPVKAFFLRTGFATWPFEIAAGMGCQWKKIHLDMGSTYKPIVGFSPNITCSFNL